MKQALQKCFQVLLPLMLGGAILWWMYRNFDFQGMWQVMTTEMDWTWMWLSFPFGILAQAFRGWRWCLALDPIGEHTRKHTSVNSIFVSYAVSLLIPRVGEFTRCAVIKRYDGSNFAKALGTVVVERAVDSLLILLFTATVLLMQVQVFGTFFDKTGTNLDMLLHKFTGTGYLVTLICGASALAMLFAFRKHLSIYNKVKVTAMGVWEGILSLKQVRSIPLYLTFSVMIWVCYFLHYYLTFFCFDFTANLGLMCAMVTFIVGSIAVIVPTPNGAGPWHFAVKTMLILYGVADTNALYFVLIVHTVQTLLVVALGIYAWMTLSCTQRVKK